MSHRDGTPVFSAHFPQQKPSSKSSLNNALQLSLEKRFSHGLACLTLILHVNCKSLDKTLRTVFEESAESIDFPSSPFACRSFDAGIGCLSSTIGVGPSRNTGNLRESRSTAGRRPGSPRCKFSGLPLPRIRKITDRRTITNSSPSFRISKRAGSARI